MQPTDVILETPPFTFTLTLIFFMQKTTCKLHRLIYLVLHAFQEYFPSSTRAGIRMTGNWQESYRNPTTVLKAAIPHVVC